MELKGKVLINNKSIGHNNITEFGLKAVLQSLANNGIKISHIILGFDNLDSGDSLLGYWIPVLLIPLINEDKNEIGFSATLTEQEASSLYKRDLLQYKRLYLIFNEVSEVKGLKVGYNTEHIFAIKDDIPNEAGQISDGKSISFEWLIGVEK